jgi:hypothetical protein
MTSPPTRRSIIKRLLRVMNHMVIKLEDDMKAADARAGSAEAAVLGRLVNALGKLMDLDAAESRIVPNGQNGELLDIRDKLVRRIHELKRS